MKRKAIVGLLLFAVALAAGAGAVYAALGALQFERKQAEGGGSLSIEPAIFPHWVHRTRYRCYVCHPALFAMELGANPITMDALNKGEYCGACHNGRIAFDVDFQSCARCHRELEE
jgi:c(7)-type cytochrome triheme protein